MRLRRTVSLRLSLSEQDKDILLNTIFLYTNAYNTCCQVGYKNKTKNGIELHKLVYKSLREYLPAQLAITSRMKAIASLKTLYSNQRKTKKTFKCPYSKRMSILLDSNSYTFWPESNKVSLLTCKGRLRLPLGLNRHAKQYRNWKNTSAELIYKNRKFLLNICFEKDIEETPKSEKYIGIDRGIKKLAVTSDNQFFLGGETRRVSQRYEKLRASLQKKGSKSAKRHLTRLSGKERRFKADVNHCISKKIIDSLSPGDTIVLEDLSGIRNQRLRKKQRKNIHSWSYYQLEQFLTYKAEAKGIHIEYVDARYTSQRCSKCGHIKRSNRKSQSIFRCGICDFRLNADLNAARNIVLKHLDAKGFFSAEKKPSGYPDRVLVNMPISHCENQQDILVDNASCSSL